MPYLLAGVSRRAELRADHRAAALGFAPMMVEVLGQMQAEEAQAAQLSRAAGDPRPRRRGLAGLLASHPDYHTRLHHLRPYL